MGEERRTTIVICVCVLQFGTCGSEISSINMDMVHIHVTADNWCLGNILRDLYYCCT